MSLPPLFVDVVLKATLVLVLAMLLGWSLRRAAAAVRHLLWTLTLLALAILPVLGVTLPAWHFSCGRLLASSQPADDSAQTLPAVLPLPTVQALSPTATQPVAIQTVASVGATEPVAVSEPVAVASPEQAFPWVLTVWLVGLSAAWLWLAGGLVSLWLLGRRSELLTTGPAVEVLADLAAELGLGRRLRLLVSDSRSLPMTWGWFRPTVLLPRAAQGWSRQRLRLVLLHELGHVRHGDFAGNLLACLVRGCYWLHPLAWLACSRFKFEQELACDDFVLGQGAPAADYAAHLLAVVAGLPEARLPEARLASTLAAGMNSGMRLRQRVEKLLDANADHRPLRGRAAILAALAALALLVPLATGQPAVAHDEVGGVQANPSPAAKADDTPKEAAQDKEAFLAGQKKLAEIRKKLRDSYVAPLDDKQLAEEAIRGMLQALKDPYTDYLPPDEVAKLAPLLKGGATGIGAQLRLDDGRLTVQTPLEGSPALKAGLRPGDVIEAIDGQGTRGLSLNDAVKKILGPSGEPVKLKVVHGDGVVEEITIRRAAVVVPTLQGFCRSDDDSWRHVIDPTHRIAYVRILQFGPRTAADLKSVLVALVKDGLKGLILDLRSCPGGFLNQALQSCKFFIKEGDLLQTQGPNKEQTTWKADGKDLVGDFPLVVLIDERTASAAEIVAGALRDHDRAILLGTRTYGKGSGQALVKLDAGGMLRVTTAYHRTPKGRSIHKLPDAKTWGIDPSDGYYFPVTDKQAAARQLDVQKREVVGLKKEERVACPARLTPRVIEEHHADPVLAASLRTLVARITGGEFVKVGKGLAEMHGGLRRLEELRRRQDELRESLRQVERAIAEAGK